MPIAEIMNAVRNAARRNYCESVADCPVCGADMLIRTNSAGQTGLHCIKRCPLSDILHALGLTHAALFPANGKLEPLAPGWWKESPRYAAGPVRPQSEQ